MLTRFVVRQMQKQPRSRASWHRWYRVYRALPHWQFLRWRMANGRRVHIHHLTYATLSREKPGRDVIAVSPEQHARIHERRA